MAEASDLTQELLRRQNTDGGWGYSGKSSWTEPTALAVLALESVSPAVSPLDPSAARRGRDWLLNHERPDGGWAPNPVISESTSVTSLVALALSTSGPSSSHESSAHARALDWILSHIQPELGPVARLEFWLNGMPPAEATCGGSPWFPGTASWIAPTAMSVLALTDASRQVNGRNAAWDIAATRGQAYILSRRCVDGGWNHGGTQFRSEAANAYPEMTGMALLALTRAQADHTEISLRLAERMQAHPESSEGESWLALALAKHGRALPAKHSQPPRTTRDLALQTLASTAGSPSNKFTETNA